MSLFQSFAVDFASRFLSRIARRLCMLAFAFHPAIQQILLKSPAIAQLEGGNAPITKIFVEGIGGDTQILRCLAQCHHFLESFHFRPCLFLRTGVLFGLSPSICPVFRRPTVTAVTY